MLKKPTTIIKTDNTMITILETKSLKLVPYTSKISIIINLHTITTNKQAIIIDILLVYGTNFKDFVSRIVIIVLSVLMIVVGFFSIY